MGEKELCFLKKFIEDVDNLDYREKSVEGEGGGCGWFGPWGKSIPNGEFYA